MIKIEFIKGHKKGRVETRNERSAKTLFRLGLAKKHVVKKEEKQEVETKELKTKHKTKR